MAPLFRNNYETIRALSWTTIGVNVYIFTRWNSVLMPKEARITPTTTTDADLAKATAAHKRYMLEHYTLSLHNLREGRYATLLTSAFSHAALPHLAVNMLMLHQSASIAALLGLRPLAVTVLALASALGGSAGWLLDEATAPAPLSDQRGVGAGPAAALGASGMVQGMLVATAAAAPRLQVQVLLLPVPVSYYVVVGGFLAWDLFALGAQRVTGERRRNWMGATVAYGAHLGGAVAGGVFYLVAMRRGRMSLGLLWKRRR